jgi:hypothetical protein
MMTDSSIRLIGEGVIACSLPKVEWTHAAHLQAALWWHRHHPELVRDGKVGDIIRRYNEATGTENTDNSGYHETITLAYLRLTRWYIGQYPAETELSHIAEALLNSPFAAREWPLEHWHKGTLFSALARREWIAPDIQPLPF